MSSYHVRGQRWFGRWRYVVLDRCGGLVACRHEWIEALAHAIQGNHDWRRRREAEVRRLERMRYDD